MRGAKLGDDYTRPTAIGHGSRGGPIVMLTFCVVVSLGALTLLRASLRVTAWHRDGASNTSRGRSTPVVQ